MEQKYKLGDISSMIETRAVETRTEELDKFEGNLGERKYCDFELPE